MPRKAAAPDLEAFEDTDTELDPWVETTEENRRHQLRGPICEALSSLKLEWTDDGALIEELCDLVIDARRLREAIEPKPVDSRHNGLGGRKSQDLAFELINSWASALSIRLGALEANELAVLTAELELKVNPIGFYNTVVQALRQVSHGAEALIYRSRRNSEKDVDKARIEYLRDIAEAAAQLEIALIWLRTAPGDRLTLAIHAVINPEAKDRQAVERANAFREIQGSIEWALQVLIAASEASKRGGRGPIKPPAALETIANLCAFWEGHYGTNATVTFDGTNGTELVSPAGRFVDAMMRLVDPTYTRQMTAGWMRKAGEKRRAYRVKKQEKAAGTNSTLSAPENLHSVNDAPTKGGGVHDQSQHLDSS